MSKKRFIAAALAMLTLNGMPVSFPVSAKDAQVQETSETVYVVDSGLCGNALQWWLESDGTLTVSGNDKMTSTPWKQYAGKLPSNDESEQTEEPEKQPATIKKVIVDKDVAALCSSAFSNCIDLKEVVIKSTVLETIPTSTFSGCKSLSKITLPKQITAIGESAFRGCTALTGFTVPSGVTKLEGSTFLECTALKSVTLPKNLETIGASCFRKCTALMSVAIPESVRAIENGAFAYAGCLEVKNQLQIVDSWVVGLGELPKLNENGNPEEPALVTMTSCTIPEGIRGITNNLLTNHKELTSLSLPASLAYINANAFSGTGISSLTLPQGMRELGDSAFKFCISLNRLAIENGLETIGDEAFSNCNRLPSLTLPASIKYIGKQAFYDCTALTVIRAEFQNCDVYTEKNKSVQVFGFSTEKEISRTVTCYSTCSWLVKIAKETEGYTYISKTPEGNGWKLENGTLYLSSVENVDSSSWSTVANKIFRVAFEDASNRIPNGLFANCTNLTEITLPESVAEIGDGAFSGCTALKKVTVMNPACSISDAADTIPQGTLTGYCGSSAENYAAAHELKFDGKLGYYGTAGKDAVFRYASADQTVTVTGTGEMNIFTSSYNKKVQYWDSVIENAEHLVVEEGITYLCGFSDAKKLETVSLPASLKEIGEECFSKCTALKTVDLRNTMLTAIPKSAFYSCGLLEHVVLNDRISSIGEKAFYYCESLHNFSFPSSLRSIGTSAFEYCRNLADKDGTIQLNDGLVTIGGYAFSSCGLKDISIPANVKEIGSMAFYSNSINRITLCGETTVSEYAFDLVTLVIGGNPTWEQIKNIRCDRYETLETCTAFKAVNGALYTGDMKEMICFPNEMEWLGDGCRIDIPSGVERIRAWAMFQYENSIGVGSTSGKAMYLHLPESVSVIEEYAVLWGKNVSSRDLYLTIDNPECEIADTENGLPIGATICGAAGSAAEAYARKYKREFITISGECGEGVTYYHDLAKSALYLYGSGTAEMYIPRRITAQRYYTSGNRKEIEERMKNAVAAVVVCSPDVDISGLEEHYYSNEKAYVTVYGFEGSAAESGAERLGIKFKSILDSPYADMAKNAETTHENPVSPALCSGDVNGDGVLSVGDAVLLCRYVSEDENLNAESLHVDIADMNGDSLLTVEDVTEILYALNHSQ